MKTLIDEYYMSSFTISEYACIKNNVSQEEVMIGIIMNRAGSINKVLNEMIEKGYLLDSESGEIYIDHKFDKIVKKVVTEKGDVEFETRCRELARKMMDIFPKGAKPNNDGTRSSYYWKCNLNEVVNKLVVFFKEYGDYKDELILEATQKYVSKNYPDNQRGMRILKYFIYKTESDGEEKERKSDLATMLTALENGEDNQSEDWSMNLLV